MPEGPGHHVARALCKWPAPCGSPRPERSVGHRRCVSMDPMTTPRRPGTWRWVAHPPWRPPVRTQRPPAPRHRLGPAWGDRTPTYPATPRWGLPPVVLPHQRAEPTAPGRARLASWAPAILQVAQTWFIGTALFHGLRYAVLAWYADRLAPWWLDAVTTALVWVSGTAAVVLGALAAIAATAWLVEARRRAYAPDADPRRRIELWLGSLVVVVTYFRTPVYLEELRRSSPRAPGRAVLRRWWLVWLLNGVLVALAVWRGTAYGPQAAADTVLLTTLAGASAAWAVHRTRVVMGSFTDPSPRFTRRLLVRGIVKSSASRKE